MTKKARRFQAILSFNLFISALYGSSIGNPADPAILDEGFWISDQRFSSLRFGVTGDILLNKRLRSCRVSQGLGIKSPELEWTLVTADLGLNIYERLDVHLLGGPASSVDLRWQQQGGFYRASGDQGFFWGASAKLILLEVEDTTLGFDAVYGGIADIEGPLSLNGAPYSHSFSGELHFWQVASGLSQHLGAFRPYVGAVVNQFVYKVKERGLKSLRFHDLLQVGSYEGCAFSLGSKIFLNIEVRQFYESGFSLSGELRF